MAVAMTQNTDYHNKDREKRLECLLMIVTETNKAARDSSCAGGRDMTAAGVGRVWRVQKNSHRNPSREMEGLKSEWLAEQQSTWQQV